MEKPQSRTIADVFNILDCWRHLPAYRLELQVAPFFALFLGDVLRWKFGVEMHPIVIPEFPLKVDTLAKECCGQEQKCPAKNGAHPNQSYNVDYVAFSQDLATAYLVELKTDMGSLNTKQQCYLHKAASTCIRHLICGAIEISKNTAKPTRTKYIHLLHRFSKLGLVDIPNSQDLYHLTFPTPQRGDKWLEALKQVVPTVGQKWPERKVVYIQPQKDKRNDKDDFEYIYFSDVANVVQGHGELGVLFANYLRAWTAPAGERNPEEIAHYR